MEIRRALRRALLVCVLAGAISCFMIGDMPDLWCLGLFILFMLLWARIAAKFANKASAATLNRVTGGVLTVLRAAILIVSKIS